jgi:uncharacterized protein
MLTTQQFQQISEFVHHYLVESATRSDQPWLQEFPRAGEHRWQHTLNVLRNAEQILAGEGVRDDSADVVRAAVLLHDISMFVCDHEMADKYLREQNYPQDFVGRVTRAIAEHGTDLGPLLPEAQGALFSWEGKVVLEADILDKLGASAIADSLLSLGKKGRLGCECRKELAQGWAMERAALFKDYIWTETGKRMAEQRFAFFQSFLTQLAEEVFEGSSPL